MIQGKGAICGIVAIAGGLVLVLLLAVWMSAEADDTGAPVFISIWRAPGTKPGEFSQPFGVAVDAEGFVYVTDAGNHRVQKFNRDGSFMLQWGKKGNGSGEFIKPTGIAIGPDGTVYVSDYFADTIQRFTQEGQFLGRWGRSDGELGAFDSPSGVAVDQEGMVYVVDEYHFRIQAFTEDGKFVTTWGKKGKVHVVRSVLNRLIPEDREGEFYYPAHVAVGPDRSIYVADSYNNRVQVFTPEGRFLRKWGGLGF